MKFYHWYTGAEKPDQEYHCIVAWKGRSKVHRELCETVKSKHRRSYRFYESGSGTYVDPRQIIAWMPIEFPREV